MRSADRVHAIAPPAPTVVTCVCALSYVDVHGADGVTDVLSEVVKNTGNFSWIVANFNHAASTDYYIHILPVLGVQCDNTGLSSNFATTPPFRLEAQRVSWAWPLPEGAADLTSF